MYGVSTPSTGTIWILLPSVKGSSFYNTGWDIVSQSPVIFKDPQIYFPRLFKAVFKTVPHISLSSKEAVAAGYSFPQKRHSVKITKYHGKPLKELIISYSINGLPMDEIRKHSLETCPSSTVNIHGKMRRLGKDTFRDYNMKIVVFEDGITSLFAYTFYECKSLQEIHIPQTLKLIGTRCFMFCKNLKYIEFPKSICDMEYLAFHESGLEHFAEEALTLGINNADAFSDTPLFDNNQVVCTYPDHSYLIILHGNGTYYRHGAPLKFKADSITFCHWSLWSFSIDPSECKKVRFYRNAIRDEREKNMKHTLTVSSPVS